MSLQTRLADFVAAVGADIKQARARLTDLETVRGEGLRPGVTGSGSFVITLNSSSQVTVSGGTAWGNLGSGLLTRSTAPNPTVFSGIPATPASNRLDQIYFDLADGLVKRAAGTPGASVSKDNRTGFAALPATAVLLYDIQITASGITADNIRDRRPFAFGSSYFAMLTGGDQTMTPGSPITFAGAATITGTQVRLECTGAPVTIEIVGQKNQTTNDYMVFYLSDQGPGQSAPVQVPVPGFGPTSEAKETVIVYRHTYTPTPGSHLFSWRAQASAGISIVRKTASIPLFIGFREDVTATQNSNNGTT